jgi:hypothetical protein
MYAYRSHANRTRPILHAMQRVMQPRLYNPLRTAARTTPVKTGKPCCSDCAKKQQGNTTRVYRTNVVR